MDVTEERPDAAAEARDQSCAVCGRMNPSDARFCSGCGQPTGAGLVAPGPAAVADPLIGRVIADRYRIVSLIGRGGMGVVYKVEHMRMGKLMAIKLLHGELARNKDMVKRFRTEAEAVSKLNHPNTVQIFDFGRSEGLVYIVMEYVAGRDFGSIIQHEGPLAFSRIARIVAQVCASVAEAHDSGVVHRDIKPENIMVSQTRSLADFVKVLDFGLAKLREADERGGVTRAGALIGTPYYMAPEHIRGDPVDHRVDIYAVGAVLYKAITGVPPFSAATPVGVLTKHLTEPVVPPSERSGRRDLPPEADAIVMRAMQKDPADRYQRAEDVREDLIAYLRSIGEDPSYTSTSRLTRGSATAATPVPSPSGHRVVVEVATRGDVDKYERRLRRVNYAGWVLAALVLGAAITGGVVAFRNAPTRALAQEVEPNDTPAKAHDLPEAHAIRAHLGRRLGPAAGDRDVYSVRNTGGARRVVRIEASAIPNMDIAIDVVRSGVSTPDLVIDSRGEGEGESVPNFVLTGSRYFLQVREASSHEGPPTENVSDPYTIEWHSVAQQPDDEHEFNNSLEIAELVAPGGSRRGYIGWKGDVDTFCLAEAAPALRMTVTPVPGVDLVMRVVDRMQGTSDKVDAGDVGEGERSAVLAPAPAETTCVELTASAERGAPANPVTAYTLAFERADGEASPGSGGAPETPAPHAPSRPEARNVRGARTVTP